jgi:hypothetical protein
LILYDAKFGAYTMLFSGFSPSVDENNNGAYIWPWGRILPVSRADIVEAATEGKAKLFWDWCEDASKKYL